MARRLAAKFLSVCLIIALSSALSGCFAKRKTTQPERVASSKKRYHIEQDIGPHAKESIPNLHLIPDAKPKHEPKSKIGNPKSYTVFKKKYQVLPSSKGYVARGKASWYGKKFHGYHTSNGEVYDMYAMSAAHKTLPLPTYARVTNLDNGKSIIVKINDRGPFHEDRIIDLSYAAASKLGMLNKGTGNVEIKAIDTTVKIPLKYIQVGAFNQEHNARQLALKLKHLAKDHPVIIKHKTNKQNRIFHVHIGPIADETIIDKLKTKLISNNFPNPVIVQQK